MKEKVYFIPVDKQVDDAAACARLMKLITSKNMLGFIAEKDMVAIKTHFGEGNKTGHVRPMYLKMLGELVREQKGKPFLTETQTLYKGNRTDAVSHLNHAQAQGYGYEHTGMPIIMADGLYGDEETEVVDPGENVQIGEAGLRYREGERAGVRVAFHRPPGDRFRLRPQEHGDGMLEPPGQDGPAFNGKAENKGEGLHRAAACACSGAPPRRSPWARRAPSSTARNASAAASAWRYAASTPWPITGAPPMRTCRRR